MQLRAAATALCAAQLCKPRPVHPTCRVLMGLVTHCGHGVVSDDAAATNLVNTTELVSVQIEDLQLTG